jgi:hypothetical protein
MRIKMLKTQKGSPDGVTVVNYLEGQEYDINIELSKVFIMQKWAIEIKKVEVKSEIVPENKMLNEYENKKLFSEKKR